MTSLNNNKTTSATDYTYDGNGNLSIDKNKDISLIHYNFLNLPDSIVVTNKGSIKYVYDAAGNKLKKVTTEGAKVTTTLYLYGNYVNDTLQYLPTEEGRVRYDTLKKALYYDYFIKDHLGNIRMLLTEQKDTSFYPVASLETAQLAGERLYYSKVDSGRVNKSTVSGYPNDTYTNPNDYIQKLNGNGTRIGAGIVLKVMAGDKFNLRVNSWWKSANSPGTPANPLNDLLSALNSGVSGASSGHYTPTDLSSNNALNPGATDFLNSHTGYSGSIPTAFVNWVLFDEQFKFVSSSSGFEQVGSSNIFKTHTKTNVALNKSGYLYIYVSNETPNIDVFFDNLQVTHIRGPLLEETHYYPFGLVMQGISGKALAFGSAENKKKYNGEEINTSFDLNSYEFFYRTYDPQIGRWHGLDTKPTKMFSPYAAMSNNPILFADPLGDTTYRFNMEGVYLGMVDLDVAGIRGVAGNMNQFKDAGGNMIDQFNPERNFNFNDGELDKAQLGTLKVGEHGITFLNDENINAIMSDAGVKKESNLFTRWSKAFENSPTGEIWDFSSSYFLPASGLKAENKIPDGDTKGGFFVVGSSSNVAYNINDAGNYLWGQAMSRIGIDLGNVKIAAHINSKATGNGWDSPADQRAIGQGYVYKVRTTNQVTNRIFLAPSVRKNANHPKQKGW